MKALGIVDISEGDGRDGSIFGVGLVPIVSPIPTGTIRALPIPARIFGTAPYRQLGRQSAHGAT